MEYDLPLFRPPSEARSLIFQVTLGCSWNRCLFRTSYGAKEFQVRPRVQRPPHHGNDAARGQGRDPGAHRHGLGLLSL